MKETLKIAIPKGYLFKETIRILNECGYDTTCFKDNDRKLFFYSKINNFKYIITRPMDVPVYVEHGACDIGFVGKDVLLENEYSVFELLDLGNGKCRMILATGKNCIEDVKRRYEHFGTVRVATKYPNIAKKYFEKKGMQAEIIKLYGSVELAPILGIADEILDITATGKTLLDNDLVEMENVVESTTRLIANEVSYRIRYETIEDIINKIKKVIK
ncbi:MAG: ATP phosphoribosyltransferase [Actinomycetota bacterium]|nr:ATP phosphoribosyltransferase [Actinomycetota bacterium]